MIPINQSLISSVLSQAANKYGLDHNLVLAIVAHETNGMNFKTRYEPSWKYLYLAKEHAENLNISIETETIMQSMSWGLMQIMGSVAREHGFEDDLPKLTDPLLGLDYGCQHLKHKLDVYNCHETDAISAYNAGKVIKETDGTYSNQSSYVDPVCAILRELRGAS